MEDIIDIIVTETTNTIEITSQPTDEIIDVNIIDNREDITLNVTPSLVEININSLTGNFGVEWGDITGTLADQTDLNTALGLKADLVDGKVPSSQLPSYVDDIIEVATYSALPATGETGKIYVVLDTNLIYRWSGSAYIEIKDSSAVWGAITGTLSSQTDLQNALNAKFDDPTGDTTQYIAGDGSLITFPVAGQAGTLVREVRNTTGSTITKGTVVYISGATGNKPTISKALATSDSTSAQTFGLAQADISNNSNGYVVCVGDLTGIDTSALTEGQQLYLSSTTAGAYTTTKQLAPAHLVYIGVVTRSHPTLGQIEVKIQNGYELDEIHDVAISSVANNDGIFYESSTSLWKNKSIATVLGYTPANDASVVKLTGNQTIEGIKTFNASVVLNSSLNINSGYYSILNNPANSAYWQTYVDSSNLFIFGYNGTNPKVTINSSGNLTANSLIKSGGTSSQFLKADGSVDSTAYLALTGGTVTGAVTFSSTTAHTGTATFGVGSPTAIDGSDGRIITNKFRLYSTTPATIYSDFVTSATSNRTITIPDASGTMALTSDLSSYLPLSGGTLTAALTISTSSGQPLTLNSTDTSLNQIIFNRSGTTLGKVYLYYNTGTSIPDMVIGTYATGGRLRLETDNNVTALTIDSSQNAQFVGTISSIGATLTGALNGTSASFTANVSSLRAVLSTSASYSAAGTIGYNSSDGSYIWAKGGSSSNFTILNDSGSSILTILSTGNTTINSTDLNSIFVSNSTTTGSTTGSGIGFKAYNGTSVAQSAGIFLTSSTWTYGTYSANQLSIGSDGTGGLALRTANSAPIVFLTGGASAGVSAEKMRITSAGNVGIGITSTSGKLHIVNTSGTGQPVLELQQSNSGSNIVQWKGSGGSYLGVISDSGYLGVGTASPNYQFETAANTTNYAAMIRNTNSSTPNGLYVYFDNSSSSGTSQQFFRGESTAGHKAAIYTNGSFGSATGTYGSIVSDIRLKENVLDASSKLEDLLKLRVVNFNLIEDTDKRKQIGFIAQEFKEIFPSLVYERDTREYDENGNLIKGLQDSLGLSVGMEFAILTKAIQELNYKIEQLKNK